MAHVQKSEDNFQESFFHYEFWGMNSGHQTGEPSVFFIRQVLAMQLLRLMQNSQILASTSQMLLEAASNLPINVFIAPRKVFCLFLPWSLIPSIHKIPTPNLQSFPLIKRVCVLAGVQGAKLSGDISGHSQDPC